jgi:hypothetical protein
MRMTLDGEVESAMMEPHKISAAMQKSGRAPMGELAGRGFPSTQIWQLDGTECVVFGVQGKAQRRGMVIPFQGVATLPCATKTMQSGP